MNDLPDRAEREVIRSELDRNVVVEAAAGTGKTTELVKRIIAVLASGRATVDGLVAVTFTEKAAGELKLRLRAGLEQARQEQPADLGRRAHLEAALARLEEARVSTIHGFCADLLRERPVEALVDPEFRVLTEPEAESLYAEAFQRWLHEHLEDPPEGVRRSLRRTSGSGERGRSERLRRAGWTLASWRDFPARWRRERFDRRAAIDAAFERVRDFAQLTRHCAAPDRDNLYKDTAKARRLSDDVERSEAVRPRDHDGLEAALVELAADRDFGRARRGYGKFYAKEVERASVLSAHAELRGRLEAFARAADADLASVLQGELLETVRRYEQLKQRIGVLDFVDLLVRARDLIRGSAEVRTDLQRRFSHLFVDEFQDTDPLQAEILLLLASADASVTSWREVRPAPGKLFVVGDPKQSIYRFRRADVGAYLEATRLLIERGARSVQLTTSFRAIPSLQRAVNAAFAPLMDGDAKALQAEYVPLSPFREEPAAQPAIVALPVPRPYGKNAVTQKAIERSLPDAVAAFVEWLLASGWTVTERERPDERVRVSARHVCLLFRRFDSFFAGDVTRGYVRALEARGIPHLLVGGKSFHAREEVETMRAALCAVEWPDDELSVFATLRGSLFSVADEELLQWRHRFGRFHPFRLPQEPVPPELSSIVEGLGLLARLHRGRNHRTVAETINLLLEATRAHAGFALRPSGEQALANVLHIAEIARAYEMSGGVSFRAFVERLLGDAESAQTAEAPILEEGSEGVRIMTTHKAKGLEFPVVVLADITAKQTGQPARYIDPGRGLCALRIAGWAPADLRDHEADEEKRDEAEGLRVAYVAATRARDLLVVPVVGDQPFTSGWVSCLNGALYPPAESWRASRPAPACPAFGADSTLERPPQLAFDVSGVKPGLHHFDGEGYGVVWWDPHALVLDAEPRFGIRQQELIGKETKREVVDADLSAYEGWRVSRQDAVERGSEPSLLVRTATEQAAKQSGSAAAVKIIELARDPGRPAGPRYGALLHAVLATAAFDDTPERVAEVAALQGRVLGAADEEVASASAVAAGVFSHPLMRRAAAAAGRGRCRRETPVTLRLQDGTLIEGVVDLAFLEDGTWTVVDFKTDREIDRGVEVYRRQVALYAEAISRAAGLPAEAVLLRI
jgi:ATP-dependent helicase/nuclease subunit A